MIEKKEELNDFSERVAFKVLPYKRDQDVIEVGNFITKSGKKIAYVSVVDGWNNPGEMPDDSSGRIVAERVSKEFPYLFLERLAEERFDLNRVGDIAEKASIELDKTVLSWYPAHASCVGSFLFDFPEETVIVAIGTVTTLVWNGKIWKKPKEIGDYILDPDEYESGGRTFFGRGELKNNPFYTSRADTVVVPKKTPVFIATDGLIMEKKMMTFKELNDLSRKISVSNAKDFIDNLSQYIEDRRHLQKDDISIFVKTP